MTEGHFASAREALYDSGQEIDTLKALHAAIDAAQTDPRGNASYPEVPKWPTDEWTPLSSVTVTHPDSGAQTTITRYQQAQYPCEKQLTEVSRTDDLRRIMLTDDAARYTRLSRGVGRGMLRHLNSSERRTLAQIIEESH